MQDIESNKVMAVLAYLGILVLVPLLAAKESRFARFHTNQGLILLLCNAAWGIVYSILTTLFAAILGAGFLFLALTAILNLTWLVFLAFTIIGIVNAVQGKMKELPIIGKYRILK